ncbi:glycosyltransferase family 2 protein [Inquilinus sp. NPDC058860]|uniref:glycosyltransferase family 2 protein n=1 Tax=Inquilinus sp. NPDC058860 TaxID=3346652 RepID=UPI00367A6BBB
MDSPAQSDLPEVDVLVATYNGEQFLPDLLDSLLAQSHDRINVIVGDDGSADGTRQVVERYRGRFRSLEVHDFAAAAEHGARANFSRLMARATASYVMFCDQDDVWLPNKVELTLRTMRSLEASHGRDRPILVHTDLRVVDRDLKPVADSMWRSQEIRPERASLRKMLVENSVTGCAAMINRPLLTLVGTIPDRAIMHDWWTALVAACFGTIAHLDERTILYRQHGGNSIGAKRWSLGAIYTQFVDVVAGEAAIRSVQKTIDQAAAFHALYGDRMRPEQRSLVKAYSEIKAMPSLSRKAFLIRSGLIKSKWQKSLGQILVT